MTRLMSLIPRFFMAAWNSGHFLAASSHSLNSSSMIDGWTPSASPSNRETDRRREVHHRFIALAGRVVQQDQERLASKRFVGRWVKDERFGGLVQGDGHEPVARGELSLLADGGDREPDFVGVQGVERVPSLGFGRGVRNSSALVFREEFAVGGFGAGAWASSARDATTSTKGAKIIPPTKDLTIGLAFGMAVFLGDSMGPAARL